MIINFSVENWISFRNEVSFSMIASRERQHSDQVPKIAKYQAKILPITAIYSTNTSGKTNFFKTLSFIKQFVLKPISSRTLIPVEPYRLDTANLEKPSHFKLE